MQGARGEGDDSADSSTDEFAKDVSEFETLDALKGRSSEKASRNAGEKRFGRV
jgi:FKBP-type peptidyl-prolyl cis-trans isomerase (trigger factor)